MKPVAIVCCMSIAAGCATTTTVLETDHPDKSILEFNTGSKRLMHLTVRGLKIGVEEIRVTGDSLRISTDLPRGRPLPQVLSAFASPSEASSYYALRIPATEIDAIGYWDRAGAMKVGAVTGAILLGLPTAAVFGGFCGGDYGGGNCAWRGVKGFLAGGVLGGAFGASLAAAVGPKGATIYRREEIEVSVIPAGTALRIKIDD